jgi:prephenate dehydratase
MMSKLKTNLNKKMIIMKWKKKKGNLMKILRNMAMSKMNMSALMINKNNLKEFNQLKIFMIKLKSKL